MVEGASIDHDALGVLLATWLPRQRWFGGKGRADPTVTVVADTPLRDGEPALHHLLLRVRYADGGEERYQVLLGVRRERLERLEHAVIGPVGDDAVGYDAAHDNELTSELLSRIAGQDSIPAQDKSGALQFFTAPGAELDTTLTSRVLGHEQSNTSLVYGDNYILKLFRKVASGVNPDVEVTLALAEAGSPHVARPLGWIEGAADGDQLTLAFLQEFLRSGTEGWALATISVRDLYAEGDLHADEVGGDFAAEAERLGAATAEVHRTLADAFGTRELGPDDLAAVFRGMQQRLDQACAAVAELRPLAGQLAVTYAELPDAVGSASAQRVHGDLHLGQVLRTETGWVLLDFEGEPARPLAERRQFESPLRDVAGMLRSFDYAARYLLMEQPSGTLEYRASEWAERNKTAFLDGYAKAAGRDPREDGALLRAFELDKAVYEVGYEARNRPSWLPIPLGTIERLAGNDH